MTVAPTRVWACGSEGCRWRGDHPGGRRCPSCGGYCTLYIKRDSTIRGYTPTGARDEVSVR